MRAIRSMELVVGLVLAIQAGSAHAESTCSPSYEPPRPWVSNELPVYPDTRGVWREDEGTVMLRVTIGSHGMVMDAEILEGTAPFVIPALKAVRRWRYDPARENGRAIDASWDVRMRFEKSRRTSALGVPPRS